MTLLRVLLRRMCASIWLALTCIVVATVCLLSRNDTHLQTMDLRYNSRIHIDANMTPTQLLPSRDTDFDDIQDHQSRALSDAFSSRSCLPCSSVQISCGNPPSQQASHCEWITAAGSCRLSTQLIPESSRAQYANRLIMCRRRATQ